MTLLSKLINKALQDPYLLNLITKIEYAYSNYFIGNNFSKDLPSEKEYIDLLRFADILSRSELAEARNYSYKIISLLFTFYADDHLFKAQSANVLTILGNFPSLELATKGTVIKIDEIAIAKIIKETYQKAPESDNIFTDAQYDVFERMKDSNHFSFSGPTSFGKSFIFESYIKYLIDKKNSSDNIAFLVPTRALINQVSSRLKSVITNDKYKIITHPTVPLLYRKEEYKFIFVFTPERLISYLSEVNPVINYLLIDEAHKLLSETDTRAPLFYHALMLAKRKSINLYFSSPNVPNTEIFLQLFGNSTEESISIKDSSVAQNRFFIDCVEKRALAFSEYEREIELDYKGYGPTPKECLTNALDMLGKNHQNIIYCNTKEDTINYALEYADKKPNVLDNELRNLIQLIEETMHYDYFLIDCLKKGVAYHFGGLPQQIREQIELLFQKKIIKEIFCTSTLLEGVNLPAKNIFILSNAIGLKKFSRIDFWNLAGRAGRLTEDLSGNIICLRIEEKRNRWDNPKSDLQIVKEKKVKKVSSVIMTNSKRFYQNVGRSIIGESFTRKNVSDNEKKILDSYGNILTYHSLSKTDSILRSKFIDSNTDAKKILEYLDKENKVPTEIVAQSSSIKLIYQNGILSDKLVLPEIPIKPDYQSCLKLLNDMYDLYNWEMEESGGHSPLAKNREVLDYYAFLMNQWINSYPLNIIINKTIKYFVDNNKEVFNYTSLPVLFDKHNRKHVNELINKIISDIENILRFKIKSYTKNYVELSKIKNQNSSRNTLNISWDDYLEYGTTDLIIIELQNLGFPRHLAAFLKKNYLDFFIIEEDTIVDFYEEKLLDDLFNSSHKQEFLEIKKTLGY